ncbi:hypothetical protein [Bacillus altitudinis]|uniref:hypothetical protein n=1 Tax=Bacillus altitudinis TaxID=293387 RepID=UPI0034E3FA7C
MIFIIDGILENMALEGKRYFSPHYIISAAETQGVELSLKEVTEYLLSLVPNKIKVHYEMECPNGDSDFEIVSPHDFIEETKICHICSVEYITNLNRIWVYFDFTPEYIDFLKKKRITPNSRRDLLLI